MYSNFSSPTGIAFIDDNPGNFLVIEKNGDVRWVSNGTVRPSPILTLNAEHTSERGLVGLDTLKKNNSTYVFLYVSEKITNSTNKNSNDVRNHLYKFNWNGSGLTNRTLLLDLPAIETIHVGGKTTIGKDGMLYTVIGDLAVNNITKTKLQNIKNGSEPALSSSIFRINPLSGSAPSDNPFISINNTNMSKVYAFGIRNSFGLDSDPITGTMWDTENGPYYSDEINIVKPGFNSGWRQIQGFLHPTWLDRYNINATADDLVHYKNSYYSDPIISWLETIGITDIEFIETSKLGPDYTNNILVGDIKNGNLYFFKVNEDRTNLELTYKLIDVKGKMNDYILGTGFGGITDIKTGPDGKMYIVCLDGSIYTIS
jgi:glucose/arabinose dehydrogenase